MPTAFSSGKLSIKLRENYKLIPSKLRKGSVDTTILYEESRGSVKAWGSTACGVLCTRVLNKLNIVERQFPGPL